MIMDDRFDGFDKRRLTQTLTEKQFKIDKKATTDESRSLAAVAKDQESPNLRKILREEKIKDRNYIQENHYSRVVKESER